MRASISVASAVLLRWRCGGIIRQWFLCRPVCAVLDRLLKKIQPGAKGNRAEVQAIRSETELFGARLFSATA